MLSAVRSHLDHARSLRRMFTDPIGLFHQAVAEQGSHAEFRFGKRRFCLINDPDLIQDFLVTQSALFQKFPQVRANHTVFGNGLLTSEEPQHLRQRKSIQPAFCGPRLEQYATAMVESAQSLTEGWADEHRFNAVDAMAQMALQVLTSTLFSGVDRERTADLSHQMETVLGMLDRLVMPWGEISLAFPLASSRHYRAALNRIDEIVSEYIRERQHPDSRLGSTPRNEDFLDFLLALRSDHEDDMWSDRQIRDEVMTMFVAGHDTIAKGLAWCLLLLAKHPEIQQETYQAVAETLDGSAPTLQQYNALAPVRHVLSESMRLYPPVWIMGRRAQDGYRYREFEASKGDILLVSAAVLHRQNQFFEEPDQFKPERWLRPTWPRYAYIPFGAGGRLCIGERFAWMEGILCLATIIQKFRFELTDDRQPGLAPSLTLGPKEPICLVAHRR